MANVARDIAQLCPDSEVLNGFEIYGNRKRTGTRGSGRVAGKNWNKAVKSGGSAMPHIAITMFPGRSREVKAELAVKVQDFVAAELQLEKEFVSVSVEDIPKSNGRNRSKNTRKTLCM